MARCCSVCVTYRLLKKRAEVWLGRDPCMQKQQLCQQKKQSESAGHFHWVQLLRKNRKWYSEAITGHQSAGLVSKGLCRAESGTESLARLAVWGLDMQELSAWDSLQPGRAPNRQACPTPTRRGWVCMLSDQWSQAQGHLLGSYLQGKEGEVLNDPFWNFIRYYAGSLGQAVIHWNQQSREIRDRCSKGCSGTCPSLVVIQSCHQHQAVKSWPFYTDWPVISNEQLIH